MSESWKDQSEGEDVQMPLGAGGETAGEPEYTDEPKARMNKSTMMLFASFIAALAVLYLLGLHNKPRAASADQVAHDTQIQSAITELLKKNGKAEQLAGLFKDTDRLVKMFYSYLGAPTTKTEALPLNPFAQDAVGVAPIAGRIEATSIVSSNANEAEALRRVAETFNGLKLQSVMVGGKNSVAMINKNLVHVGDTIGDLTVTSIEQSRVVLSYGKNSFELKLSRDK